MSPTMYGFTKDKDGNPAIDEEQAAVVRMIYNDYLDGMSPGDIKKKLERQDIKTAYGRDTWDTTVILGMLQNEKYRGDAMLQKTYSPSLFEHRSRKNDGQLPKYYVGDAAKREMCGRSAFDGTDQLAYKYLLDELATNIAYSDYIDYPFETDELAAYFPRLSGKYPYKEMNWNYANSEIRLAREGGPPPRPQNTMEMGGM